MRTDALGGHAGLIRRIQTGSIPVSATIAVLKESGGPS